MRNIVASLFVVVVFAGGVPVWEVLDAGGPPPPYYAAYVIGQIDLGEQVVVEDYEFPRAYQGVTYTKRTRLGSVKMVSMS